MRQLTLSETQQIHALGIQTVTLSIASSVSGAIVCGAIGAYVAEPVMEYLLPPQDGFFMRLTSFKASDYYVYQKYGHLGVNSVFDIQAGIVGCFVGSILGAALYSAFI